MGKIINMYTCTYISHKREAATYNKYMHIEDAAPAVKKTWSCWL